MVFSRIPVLVFQPSKEILQQNAEKLRGYGYAPAIWSASLNRKRVGQITLATIGSVVNHVEAFRHFRYVLIDETHLVNPNFYGQLFNLFNLVFVVFHY